MMEPGSRELPVTPDGAERGFSANGLAHGCRSFGEPSRPRWRYFVCRDGRLSSFRRYATKAARSSGFGVRSKWMPSVEATGGKTPAGRRLHDLEELDVVIDDVFQGRCTVVVEVGSGLSNAVESRNVEFVPVIERRRPPTKPVSSARPGSELARRIFVPFASVNSYVRTLCGDSDGTCREDEARRKDGVHRAGQVVAMS